MMIDPAHLASIGGSRVAVSRLGFGSAPLGGLFTETSDTAAAAALAAAWRHGLRYFDTAPQYGSGLAERRVGEVLRQHPRDAYVLSSKVGKLLRPAGSGIASSTLFKGAPALDVVFDYSYDGTLRSLEESLMRLRLDRIDIVFVHDVNRKYHGDHVGERLDEALHGAFKALARMRTEGVIGAFGPALNEVDIAIRVVDEANVDCIMLPARYTLLDQTALPHLLPQCRRHGVSVVIAGPFDSGILATGAIEGACYNYAPAPPQIILRVKQIEAVCRDFQVALPAAALQFAFGHPAVAAVVTGMRSEAEVEANLALMKTSIPAGFWSTLKERGLLHPDTPA